MTAQNQSALRAESFRFLTALLESRGPSGFETEPQQVFTDYTRSFAQSQGTDSYGNAWAAVGPAEAPVVLVTGHGDEIGLIINRVEDNGYLRVFPIGGVDPQTLIARRAWIVGTDGRRHTAVVGALAIHLQDKENPKVPKLWDLFLDVGADSAAAVAEMGIRVGCWATLQESWQLLPNNRIISRALDNRIGVFAAAETLRLLAEDTAKLQHRVVAVSTVQEEIGGVGAEMVARRLKPSRAFVVDVTHATDVPGANHARHGYCKLGGGPAITHGAANHRALLAHVIRTAEDLKIPLQHEAANRYTGTDTDNIYRRMEGVPSVLVSLPNRYMHTTAEMSSLQDLEQIPRLLAGAIRALTPA